MFGRPPPPQAKWEEMYFYQRLHHLVDHAANWMVARLDWWLPTVAAGMALSLFVLSGDPVGEGGAVVLPTLTPVVRTPIFGMQLPEREGQPQEEEEEEF
ncbi:hypothetical protein LSM04_002236 [Trypanosoma melophagium]|uniref:uncharacterized protein n=1 Tax=Trypanosoma melophagium TaxID=715481 RepID=UPI00351A3111|nr:hypothetical protein LSM04_002236 [Trypanosoma melophagium]